MSQALRTPDGFIYGSTDPPLDPIQGNETGQTPGVGMNQTQPQDQTLPPDRTATQLTHTGAAKKAVGLRVLLSSLLATLASLVQDTFTHNFLANLSSPTAAALMLAILPPAVCILAYGSYMPAAVTFLILLPYALFPACQRLHKAFSTFWDRRHTLLGPQYLMKAKTIAQATDRRARELLRKLCTRVLHAVYYLVMIGTFGVVWYHLRIGDGQQVCKLMGPFTCVCHGTSPCYKGPLDHGHPLSLPLWVASKNDTRYRNEVQLCKQALRATFAGADTCEKAQRWTSDGVIFWDTENPSIQPSLSQPRSTFQFPSLWESRMLQRSRIGPWASTNTSY